MTSFSVLCSKCITVLHGHLLSLMLLALETSSSSLLLCTSRFPSCMLGERVQDAPSPKWANRHAGLPERTAREFWNMRKTLKGWLRGGESRWEGGNYLCGVSVTSILQNSGRSIKLATHLDHTGSYSRYKIFSFWQVLNFTCHSIYFKMIKKQLLYHSHSTRYHVLWIPHPRSQVWKSH